MRLQQSLLQVKTAVASSALTFELLRELEMRHDILEEEIVFDVSHDGFSPNISLENVTFRYPDSEKSIYQNFTLSIRSGEIVSIIGPSGSGKTSFVDLILGQLEPNEGSVTVSGLLPAVAQRTFPGAISYVPQEIFLFEGSIIENVLLGLQEEAVGEELIWTALQKAEIDSWVKSQNLGLYHQIKEGGSNISGGQRQRIGLARALLTNPKLVILDEATSSLDSKTEVEIANTISKLKGSATVISIAHRPAMINISSRVIDISKTRNNRLKKKNSKTKSR